MVGERVYQYAESRRSIGQETGRRNHRSLRAFIFRCILLRFGVPLPWVVLYTGDVGGWRSAEGRVRDKATGVKPRQQAMPRQPSRLGVDTGLFFLLFYLYVWLVIDPRLIHHSLGVLIPYYPFFFSTEWAFFEEHLARPGGLAEYGARFLSQLYCFGWAGALIVTAAALSTCLSTDVLTRLSGRPRGMVVRYVPAVLLLVLCGGYTQPLNSILSLLGALGCFMLYLRLAPRGAVKRLAVVVAACVALYHVAGSGSLLFPALVAIYELLIVRRMLVALTGVLCGLGMAWTASRTPLDLGIDGAFGGLLRFSPGVWRRCPYALALYVFFPTVLTGAALWRVVLARRTSHAPDRPMPESDTSSVKTAFRLLGRGKLKRAIQMSAVLLGAGATAWYSFDAPAKTMLQIDYHSQRENWTEVLAAADRMPYGPPNVRSNRNIVLALYHTGRLGDEMFRYPQTPGVALICTPRSAWDSGSYFQESRLFLDLAHVNLAEKWAYEALETSGPLPAVLKHLATINIVKDRPETAGILLNALGKDPLHRRTAREMLQRLDEDPRLENDPRIRSIRRSMLRRDTFFTVQRPVGDLLQVLLEENPRNRMAFELLMALHLCNARVDGAAANLRRLPDFEYREIPRHYQEAMVVYSYVFGREARIAGYRLDPEIIERGREFTAIIATSRSPDEVASRALAAGFGDSYFLYFYMLGASGL